MKLSLCYDEVPQPNGFPMGAHGFVLICKLTTAYNCDCDVILTVYEFGKCKCTHFIHHVFDALQEILIFISINNATSTQVFFVKKVSS